LTSLVQVAHIQDCSRDTFCAPYYGGLWLSYPMWLPRNL